MGRSSGSRAATSAKLPMSNHQSVLRVATSCYLWRARGSAIFIHSPEFYSTNNTVERERDPVARAYLRALEEALAAEAEMDGLE